MSQAPYTIKGDNTIKGEDEKKLKVITKDTIKNQINIEDYQKAIYGGVSKYVTNYTIDSKRHQKQKNNTR